MSKRINKIKSQLNSSKTSNKGGLGFVNLSSYTSPEIIESTNRDWIEFGSDNNYFQYLIDRSKDSPTAGACINSISQMIYGKGLDATDNSRKPEQYAKMISLFKKDTLRRLAYDLKLTGQCALQVIYSEDKKTVVRTEHMPIETLRAEKCGSEDIEVQAYYYHPNWVDIKPSDKPKRIPAFGVSEKRAKIEILYIKPYESGMYYYSSPDYISGIQYAELEGEIANYHINNVKNGLAPSMLINMNNGIPDEEDQILTEKKIKNKFSGSSNAGKFILAFNHDKESAADITPVQLSDAHNQYEFLSSECQKKIMVSHRIVSPMLLGIKDSTGFGNNAEEIESASIMMQNVVINPFQELLLDNLDKVLAVNNISLNLYFKTLQPLQFLDLDNIKDEETREEETGVKMSKMDKEVSNILIQKADDDMTGWELIDEGDVDYDTEDDLDAELAVLNNPKKSLLSKVYNFVKTGTARPNSKSEQDKTIEDVQYKVRYKYHGKIKDNTREFCKQMIKADKLYRKEDIISMDNQVVNAGWGLSGADKYSIWKFKGGGGCNHKWRRLTFRFTGKGKGDVKSPNADKVSTNKAEREGYRVRNPKEVSMMPKDMPNKGFVNK
jgi:hypothetical protein